MATKKTIKEPKAKTGFKLEVRVNDLVYKGESDTMEQALADFISNPNYPFAVKTAVVIKFSDSKNEKQVTWPAMLARRKFRMLSLKPSVAELIAGKFANDLING